MGDPAEHSTSRLDENSDMSPAGVRFCAGGDVAMRRLIARLEKLDLHQGVDTQYCVENGSVVFSLNKAFCRSWVPNYDTTQLSRYLDLDPVRRFDDLECEILLAMLAAPQCFDYPSYDEFASAVRIRQNIVRAARRTQLAFHTSEADRPEEFWTHQEDSGFTVLPGKSLIAALESATQPDASNKPYAFSCYRATEYVILLAIAQELVHVNPRLLCKLKRQWEQAPIKSRQFHDVFLDEYGSMDDPIPPEYYVPGDRVWFRNPDERSSEISGYEGSWVFYLGGGLFSNFWKRDQPYTLTRKCVEIFHWRDGVSIDDFGKLCMDEAVVEERIDKTFSKREEVDRVFKRMARMRDPQGVYANGGCIDVSREFSKWVCPASERIVLPRS